MFTPNTVPIKDNYDLLPSELDPFSGLDGDLPGIDELMKFNLISDFSSLPSLANPPLSAPTASNAPSTASNSPSTITNALTARKKVQPCTPSASTSTQATSGSKKGKMVKESRKPRDSEMAAKSWKSKSKKP